MSAAIRWGWIAVVLVFVAAGVIFAFRALDPADTPGAATSSTTAPPSAAFTDPNPDQPTKTETVVAVEGGRPAAGYTVEEGGQAKSCDRRKGGPEDGLVSCAVGLDVCWSGTEPTTLLCAFEPWQKQLQRRVADGPLGELDTSRSQSSPWGLDLANGGKCVRRTGGAWGGRADGLIGAYSCSGASGVVLAGDDPLIDQGKPAWTVKFGPLADNPATEFPPPEKIRIVTAYFAASK